MSLHLDETTHTYTLIGPGMTIEDGRRVISVTQALKILDDRWKVDPFYLERGRLIHLSTEYFDHYQLDEDTVDPQIQGFFDAYRNFRDNTGFVPTHIEHKLYHSQLWYAGKIDRIGTLNGKQALIDLKSGAKSRVDELQGAAYWELARANKIHVDKVFDLYLSDNGTYKLEPIQNPKSLLPVFLAALTITKYKEKI